MGGECRSCALAWPLWLKSGRHSCSVTSFIVTITLTSRYLNVSWSTTSWPNQCSCGVTYLGCHPLVCRYCTSETPSGPREVQQGIGISGIDHGSLPILQDTNRAEKAHPTPLTGPSLRSIACQDRNNSRGKTSSSNSRSRTHHHHLHISHHL